MQNQTAARQCLDLECGDGSPLSDWATGRPVPKRGRVRALQIKPLTAAPPVTAFVQTLQTFNLVNPAMAMTP
jgi:hypothetical protein